MIWNDLVVETNHDSETLAKAIAQTVGCATGDVNICHDYESMPEPSSGTVTALVSPRDRGFRLVVSLFFYGEALAGLADEVVGQGIADRLDDRCLIPSRSENPFEVMVFSPGAHRLRAFLETGPLEDEELYFLDS